MGLIPIYDQFNNICLIGVIRNIEPQKGKLALPGGYVDFAEDAKVSAQREILEETSLKISLDDLKNFDEPQLARNNNLLIFYQYNKIMDFEIFNTLKPNREVSGFELIYENTEDIAFPLHNEAIEKFFKSLSLS